MRNGVTDHYNKLLAFFFHQQQKNISDHQPDSRRKENRSKSCSGTRSKIAQSFDGFRALGKAVAKKNRAQNRNADRSPERPQNSAQKINDTALSATTCGEAQANREPPQVSTSVRVVVAIITSTAPGKSKEAPMVGSAGAMIVWSRAARNIASRIPTIMSLRSAGSIVRAGVVGISTLMC
jgi:hypothetical protein